MSEQRTEQTVISRGKTAIAALIFAIGGTLLYEAGYEPSGIFALAFAASAAWSCA